MVRPMTQPTNTPEGMTAAERQATLVNLGKLLLDQDRLKILGALAQQPCSVEQLQSQVAVERIQVHLHKLAEIGLVRKQMTAGEERYGLDQAQIFQWKKQLFARDEASQPQSTEEKDLAKFIKAERLVQLPVAPAKLRLVLEWLVERFATDATYSEKQVNERLQGHAIDHVTLRRLLIDHRLLVRESGIYQRPVND